MKNIGILDPNGENENPLTLSPYSDQYKLLAKKWTTLHAYANTQQKNKYNGNHNVIFYYI